MLAVHHVLAVLLITTLDGHGATSISHWRRDRGLARVTSKARTNRGTEGSSLDLAASLAVTSLAVNSCMVS